MARAKKEGKPKRNRGNLAKRLKLMERNIQLLKEFEKTAQDRLLVIAREYFYRYQDILKKACLWQAFFVSLYNEKKVTFYIKGNKN